jgi:hypothetical protein
LGLPGLLVPLLLLTLREPVRKDVLRTSSGKEKLTLSETLAEVRKRWQSVAGISLGIVFHGACNYGFSAWVPTHFLLAHGWSIGETGWALARISHKVSTAAAQPGMSTALRSLGLLDSG